MAEAESRDKKREEKVEEDDELGIKKLMKEVSEANRRIDEAYEEKLRRLEAKKKLIPNEKEEDLHQAKIANLNEKLKELKARISDARKEGKDPFIADLVLRNVNAKIKMAEVTHDKRDFDEVEKILKRAESELEEALKEEELDIKKEVNEKLRHDIAKETGKVIDG
jgi:uncharacterized protein YecT (DUF1311 family)